MPELFLIEEEYRQARFPGLDHGASGDPGPANRGSQPAALAPAIRSFFSQP